MKIQPILLVKDLQIFIVVDDLHFLYRLMYNNIGIDCFVCHLFPV